ncbi:MAG: alkyl hydroperoxide reductase, partial [Alphaproteobacteria bacterium]|nr:alkyl hydroperoxide reductase [Alphaproteobacteria bacterium]
QTGKPAPDYSFTDISGTKYNLAQFKGQKTVVLEWTNPGCPFVQKFYKAGEMQRVQQEALKDTQVVWFSINSSAEGKEGFLTEAQAKDFIANNNGHASAYVLDHSGKFGKLYGAKTTPHMFVIAKDGTLAYQGAIDSIKGFDPADIKKADNYVLKTLAALKEGKQPAVTSTEPYGCSVKYGD